ncbi:isoleucyl-tRNA synthetase [Bartonella bacilliformis str. Heidi Mejia]|uniref:Isoleucine--tRNA ligase n=2 Tax=Bartonella bacilliformis TaxID=774 RepID=A1UU11_BARBK|nr:isoleucine--tRNA ligase [Bartonella bacilliformis]ABM44657.1 isoleucyl-tRNA synthetase [Bartonella bacilliformis KC583]AMG86197.1 isoleucine--tRNA ligase [Bartonella bacilliformis]EKS43100.1 isoleucyl-tRNA ligase [Bartonella bacilliformis INS]EYS89017.1 isoleucyl-tRNA synthetase [Bartonella bacilliformis San Pedro600-02]EYS90979.1 isoleucyl-tRNA synthetase [Bartonella bacilliformis str. Heidi Mejia]
MAVKNETIDYSKTLYLPQTNFPMRAGLPQKELELLARWEDMDLYVQLRQQAKERPCYILHDGPPYANGNIHIGHALNKVLKDVIIRSFQMRGFNANYVPGWDCHGLPIEWKIEEKYRSQGKNKDDVPLNEFRRECREFARYWVTVQSEEFKRLGIIGDFKNPYTTMAFHSEARIASELIKFAMSDQLYCGSKPVMWSVVERTALAEAEVEYHDHESEVIWVKFPIFETISDDLHGAFVVIWTTTPWTIPGNRAVSYSSQISYSVYEVESAENDFGPQAGEKLLFADALADACAEKAKLILKRLRSVSAEELKTLVLSHPLKGFAGGYSYKIAMLDGSHVTDSAGTGFVHTAPSHGREDFEIWNAHKSILEQAGIDSSIPFPVDDAGFYTKDAPGFGPDRQKGAARVIDENGKMGDANKAVINALIEAHRLFARGRLKHSYPHSWRSKKPIIFRNTPQWFIAMDKDLGDGSTLRSRALEAVSTTRFVPSSGQNRLASMIADRPDWVLSRQRAWGVPICIFANEDGLILKDQEVNKRILQAFEEEGADAWFAEGARERFLGSRSHESWYQVRDILDVWFDSGTTHSFVLEDRPDLQWPADVYFEGSDQHRGWFQSSLLESCGTRAHSPYKAVVTHGFTLDEHGKKMSKSLGNTVVPQDLLKTSGADIFRLWVMITDYWEDQRLGKTILQTSVDSYRKLRNAIRWMLGTLAHDEGEKIPYCAMPDLEKFILHQLYELDQLIHRSYDAFDFKKIMRALLDFAITDLSAFYFDIRKDSLYCDAPSSLKRKASLNVVREIFKRIVTWLAPMLPFTMEEAWLERYPESRSVHLEQFRPALAEWKNEPLAERWKKIKKVRKVVTGALEIERADKRIGSSLEAAPIVFISNSVLLEALENIDMAEICITSALTVIQEMPPSDAFILNDVEGVGVFPGKADGKKCARSWRYTQDVGSDPEYPDVSSRDAAALRELRALGKV